LPLSGEEIRMIISARKDAEKLARIEAQVGILREPPPLLRGLDDLTPLSDIKPRLVSDAQKKRNVLDKIATIERVLRNSQLTASERARLERNLEELKKSLG
jgi:hypothetical protein